MRISAIIPVAGSGKRFASQTPKQYLPLAGKPVIVHTVSIFCKLAELNRGVVVAAEKERRNTETILGSVEGFAKKFTIINGGETRQDSVYNGLKWLAKQSDIIIVHDGVRPLVTAQLIRDTIAQAQISGACIAAVPVRDTIKKARDGSVVETIAREGLWQVQTPQTFKTEILTRAHEFARKKGVYSTDEAALVELSGHSVSIVPGNHANIKITTAEDLHIASALINRKSIQ